MMIAGMAANLGNPGTYNVFVVTEEGGVATRECVIEDEGYQVASNIESALNYLFGDRAPVAVLMGQRVLAMEGEGADVARAIYLRLTGGKEPSA